MLQSNETGPPDTELDRELELAAVAAAAGGVDFVGTKTDVVAEEA